MNQFYDYLEINDRQNTVLPYHVYALYTTVPLHWHDDIEILYTKTNGCLLLDGKKIEFKNNDIIFCNTRQLHTTELYENGLVYHIVIHPSLFQYMYPNGEVRADIKFPEKIVHNKQKYIELLDEMVSITTPLPFEQEFVVMSKIFTLLAYLETDHSLIYGNMKVSQQSSYIKTALLYIRQNCTKKIKIDEIAAQIGISQAYLMRLFKKHTGKTVISYIQATRLELAKEEILDGKAISDIAYKYGYSDSSHFCHTFKQKFGYTPSYFRKTLS